MGKRRVGSDGLTPRQRDVAALAVLGLSNREIAEKLTLSVRTVDSHLAAAYHVFGVRNRTQLRAEMSGEPYDWANLPALLGDFLSAAPGLNCWERLIVIRAGQIVASKTALASVRV